MYNLELRDHCISWITIRYQMTNKTQARDDDHDSSDDDKASPPPYHKGDTLYNNSKKGQRQSSSQEISNESSRWTINQVGIV